MRIKRCVGIFPRLNFTFLTPIFYQPKSFSFFRQTMEFFCQFLLFSLFLSTITQSPDDYGDGNDGNEDATQIGIEEQARGWKLEMVNKLRFNQSKNSFGSEFKHFTTLSKVDNAVVRMLYGVSDGDNYQPNMNINFKDSNRHDFSVMCEIAVFSEKEYQKENEIMQKNDFAICKTKGGVIKPICIKTGQSLGKSLMLKADGTYNEPSRAPVCLYDFYEMAKIMREYELFKYCAKGYFYQRNDYNDPNALTNRDEWILYLTNGFLVCDISQKLEYNQDLLARGYTIELVQRFQNRDSTEYVFCNDCPWMGIASSYMDKRKDGKFILGGIIGSMLLDYEEGESAWTDKKFEDMESNNGNVKSCYYRYNECLKSKTGRYNLELVVHHYCTNRGMLGKLHFNISVGPSQVPTRVFEDTKVKILLASGEMHRSTGKIIKNGTIAK